MTRAAFAQALARVNGLVAVRRARTQLLPITGVLARRDQSHRLPLGYGVHAASRVVGAIGADASMGSCVGIWASNPSSIGASPMASLVTSMERISSVWASMPR